MGPKVANVLLVGNKCDLRGTDQCAVSAQEGERLAKSFGVPFIETSAKCEINIESAFAMLALDIGSRVNQK